MAFTLRLLQRRSKSPPLRPSHSLPSSLHYHLVVSLFNPLLHPSTLPLRSKGTFDATQFPPPRAFVPIPSTPLPPTPPSLAPFANQSVPSQTMQQKTRSSLGPEQNTCTPSLQKSPPSSPLLSPLTPSTPATNSVTGAVPPTAHLPITTTALHWEPPPSVLQQLVPRISSSHLLRSIHFVRLSLPRTSTTQGTSSPILPARSVLVHRWADGRGRDPCFQVVLTPASLSLSPV